MSAELPFDPLRENALRQIPTEVDPVGRTVRAAPLADPFARDAEIAASAVRLPTSPGGEVSIRTTVDPDQEDPLLQRSELDRLARLRMEAGR